MPRKPRFFLPGVPVHIVQRGHSREPVFFEDNDYSAYLRWLKEGAERYKVEIHAYVLMTKPISTFLPRRSTSNRLRGHPTLSLLYRGEIRALRDSVHPGRELV